MKKRTKSKLNKIFGALSFVAVLFVARDTYAAVVYTEPLTGVGAKDVFVIEVRVDTEGASVNTVDGSITFSDKLSDISVRELSVAGSAFTIWPRKPSLSEKGNVISFVGGVPGGTTGKNILLFKAIVSVARPSLLSISNSDIHVYANDGKATVLPLKLRFTPVKIGEAKDKPVDSWSDIIKNDNVPPKPFSVELHKEKDLYNGRKFINFFTIDDGSGLDYYEVKEGQYAAVRSGETYVLNDPKNAKDVTVIAHDKAGNIQVSKLKSSSINWLSVVVVTLALVIIIKIKSIIRFFRRYAKRR